MKIKIRNSRDLDSTPLELEIALDAKVEDVRREVMRIEHEKDPDKDYEGYHNDNLVGIPDYIKVIYGGKQLENDRCIKDYGIKDNDIIHYHYPSRTYTNICILTLVCSTPTKTFVVESKYNRPIENVGELKAFLKQEVGSDSKICLKKKSGEVIALQDDDKLRRANIFIEFATEPQITTTYHFLGEELKNIRNIENAQAKIGQVEPSSSKGFSNSGLQKLSTAAGAFAGLFNTLVFSSVFRNCLPSIIVIRLSPNVVLGGTALSVLGVSLLGMCTGGVLGAAASYLYNKYFCNNKTYEVETRTIYKDTNQNGVDKSISS